MNNIRIPNGKYFVEDTMSTNGFVLLTVAKNPHNVQETRIVNHGIQKGSPGPEMMPITEATAMRLFRLQNQRNRVKFLGS